MTLGPVTDDLVERLRRALPDRAFREVTPNYLQEPRGRWRGRVGLVLAPRSVDEVSTVVREAARARVGIVPYGGGTGLVGGQVSDAEPAPILLSLERMNAIRAVYPVENVLVAEAGAILADVQEAAEDAGRLFPLALASGGSAQIGGLLATNAGGVGVLRYGNARDLVLGLEAVLADGQIWHGLRRLRKDNTGYDLRNLLVGSEGPLGIITAASLRLFPRPERTGTALFVVRDPEAALRLLEVSRRIAGDGVSAFELISGEGLRFIQETGVAVRQPFAAVPDWTVLIDLGLPQQLDPDSALEQLFTEAAEAELVSDGVIAQSQAQRDELWRLRESVPEANKRVGAVASHDISLPLGAIPGFLKACDAAVAGLGPFRINTFGHLGDGNLHYNVFPEAGRSRAEWADRAADISATVHDLVRRFEGSFSAEHGVGRLKVPELERYGDPARLWAMRRIKAALDPLGLLNPGAVLRRSQAPREESDA